MKKILLTLFVFVLLPVFSVHAEGLILSKSSTQIKASITEITTVIPEDNGLNTYLFRAKTTSNEIVDVSTEDSSPDGIPIKLVVGDAVSLQKIEGTPPQIYFEDIIRTNALVWIAILFIALTFVIGLRRGFSSLIGLGITFAVIFVYIFPQILRGGDVILTTVMGSIVILAVNMYVGHGFRKESFFAFISAIIGFLFVLLFAYLFSFWTKLSGTGSEDAVLLIGDAPVHFTTIQLFLAGVILGAVGVLDDITISQTEIVHELAVTDPTLSRKQLFLRSMRIGRHHIASTVNTLVLVYAGASMPVLLLFLYHSVNTISFLNSEVVTEEIVRTISGTTALILCVPISTLIATFAYKRK